MKVQYQILFSIEVLNTYYRTGFWKEVSFVPLPETKKLLRDCGFQIRQVKNQLLIIAPLDLVTGLPNKLPEMFSKFSFVLEPETPGYINFTNLPFGDSGLPCFCFHNRIANVVGSVNYITSPIQAYANATTYHPGDFAVGADGKTYESIKTNAGAQVPNDAVAASKNFWAIRNNGQFVTGADFQNREDGTSFLLEFVGAFLSVTTSVPQTTHRVSVYAFNFVTGNFDRQVLSDTLTSDSPTSLVQIDLRSLDSGEYKVKVNDDVRFVYHATAFPNGVPMFIDIFHLPKTDPNSFLKMDDTLKGIKYTLQFSGRRVYWRYKTRTNAIDTVLDSTGEFTFVADGPRFFISEKPLPLSDVPRKSLSANTGALVVTSPLPNPRTDRLKEKRNEIFTTESFINY